MKQLTFILIFLPTIIFCQKQYATLGATWIYEGQEIQCRGNHLQYIVESEIDIDGKDCSVIYSYNANMADPCLLYTSPSPRD